MKKTGSALAALIVLLFFLCAFNRAPSHFFSGSVKGTVSPADAGIRVWAISNRDTFRTMIADGVFAIADVRPGTYNILVEAKSPYKNGGVAEVTVIEGEVADVGEIKLTK